MSNLTINDNTFLRQFEVEIDNDLAKIEYALQDRKIFLTKLVVPNSNTNPDFEEKFIREVFQIIKEKNIRIMPTCLPIRKFIKNNKEFKDLLPIGVRL
ncbi:MAG: N-acetyltransferase [Flavobacteriales bacterium]|nr:N-acetyltransferase [Flavobacteriaceae bacterium]MAV80818.1 N-acetyltransferase [Flavobacteriales bacterium]MBK56670.1 N-acetyltransferase [Flavobacteriaceae bacterium]|tara:strand:- start:1347 stop:1640 length:294 start_codon:yes stop_codon:yes gene_type:complete